MNSTIMGLTSSACILGGTLIGMYLSKVLPVHHLSTDSKDTIKMVSGIVATLSALVLSLLIASAKGTFDTINSDIVQASAKMILLDQEMLNYGPETKEARKIFRDSISKAVDRIWGSDSAGHSGTEVIERGTGFEQVQQKLEQLNPQTDAQRRALNQALQTDNELLQSRWLVIEQAQGSLPPSLYVVLLVWLAMLFTGIGLFAPHNGTVVTTIFFCAVSLSTAIFLIQEMNRPLDGLLKVPVTPLLRALQHMDAS